MCLYETKIKNIKYLPNKKNKGIAPPCNDERLTTLSCGCGWCVECRKKLANDWRIRLTEELHDDNNCSFITLTFSPEAINTLETKMYSKKWHGLETNDGALYTDVNNVASYAIRMWSERWRKHNKKAPKHWLITELGHKNTERIHLHGLLWGDVTWLEKTWKYGNVYIGEWVDQRTINYIVKYVTKVDTDHEGYKQKIITSKGLGIGYIKRMKEWHKYKGENTINYYKTSNGRKIGLPRYYKEKLWTEDEREQLWLIQKEKKRIFLGGEEIETNIEQEKWKNKLNSVRENNKKAGYGDNSWNNKKYIITENMKMSGEIKKNDIVKWIEKRDVAAVKENTNETIEKCINKKEYYYGQYINNTTQSQRDYNQLWIEANSKQISVRTLRLIKAGIIVDKFVDK